MVDGALVAGGVERNTGGPSVFSLAAPAAKERQ